MLCNHERPCFCPSPKDCQPEPPSWVTLISIYVTVITIIILTLTILKYLES